jgi:hypothetical protein
MNQKVSELYVQYVANMCKASVIEVHRAAVHAVCNMKIEKSICVFAEITLCAMLEMQKVASLIQNAKSLKHECEHNQIIPPLIHVPNYLFLWQ